MRLSSQSSGLNDLGENGGMTARKSTGGDVTLCNQMIATMYQSEIQVCTFFSHHENLLSM